jgi:magnesium chelatase subunit D
VVIVLVTDGRGNIPLCVSLDNPFEPSVDPASVSGMPSKKFLNEEVLMCAKKIGALHDFDMLVIDTEDKFVATGIAKDLAKAALANYYHIEVANLGRVSSLTKETVESFRP